jgi:hypothetical protein
MNYELAKELKDAGFPQNLDGNTTLSGKPLKFYGKLGEPYCPTLEELLSACGQQFHSLISTGATGWDACEFKEPFADTLPLRINGPTPNEAVARLWLALNKP